MTSDLTHFALLEARCLWCEGGFEGGRDPAIAADDIAVVLTTQGYHARRPDEYEKDDNVYVVDLDWKDQFLLHSHCFEEVRGVMRKQNLICVGRFLIDTGEITEELWAEYIQEAEDQDGYTYWLHFENRNQLMADVRLYRDNSG